VKSRDEITNYLIVVNDVALESDLISGARIVDFLISRRVWIFPPYAAHLKRFKIGDRLIIYLASKSRAFVAEGRVASIPAALQGDLLEGVRELQLLWFDRFVKLERVRKFPQPRPIRELVPRLRFIRDKKNYGLSLRQGVRRIDERDARLILEGDRK
jgi:predicted RNA-binding protein